MARFYGNVGYADHVESAPGVWEERIVERPHFGDVLRNSRKLESGDHLNDGIGVNNSISIVADAYAWQHFYKIRYVDWSGVKWKVADVTVERPRLVLRLGGVYVRLEEATTPDPLGGTTR